MPTVPITRRTAPNPLILDYGASDGRRFWLLGLEGDRHWPNVLRAVDRPDVADDPRFAGLFDRAANTAALVVELEGEFAKRPIEGVGGDLRSRGRVVGAGAGHPRVHRRRAGHRCPLLRGRPGDGGDARVVATPVDFAATPWSPGAAVPEAGQHTEEVLLELGYDWDRILALKLADAIL